MSISGNALIMREVNLNLIRRALKTYKQATKQQLAEYTGLSIVTIGTLLQTLLDEHIAIEVGFVPSSGGRPAQQFEFNADHGHVMALFTHEQNGADILHIRVANLYGQCVYSDDAELSEITLNTFEGWIDPLIETYPTLRAIGFGLPGVAYDGKIILSDYQHLSGTDFLAHYSERYGLPTLFANDVNAASIGYCKRNQIESETTVLYLYFPKKYPPGLGICINGSLYKGKHNFAGEIAHVPSGVNWWDSQLYETPEKLHNALSQLIMTLSGVLAPHIIAIYASFLTAEHIQLLQNVCAEHLPQAQVPEIRHTRDFIVDYQNGVIEETLALLEPKLAISL